MISFVSLLVQSVFRLTAIGLITPRTVDMVSTAMPWPMKQNLFIIQYCVLDIPVHNVFSIIKCKCLVSTQCNLGSPLVQNRRKAWRLGPLWCSQFSLEFSQAQQRYMCSFQCNFGQFQMTRLNWETLILIPLSSWEKLLAKPLGEKIQFDLDNNQSYVGLYHVSPENHK